jgi:hypothetical protein
MTIRQVRVLVGSGKNQPKDSAAYCLVRVLEIVEVACSWSEANGVSIEASKPTSNLSTRWSGSRNVGVSSMRGSHEAKRRTRSMFRLLARHLCLTNSVMSWQPLARRLFPHPATGGILGRITPKCRHNRILLNRPDCRATGWTCLC